MHFDIYVCLGAFIVGVLVGLTGIGGGALMTPVLVLLFRVQPLAAVSSDLVASFVMKPVGGAIHLRRGTVHWHLVGWLCLGSVPAAFLAAVLLRIFGSAPELQSAIQSALGVTLMIAAAAIGTREVVVLRRRKIEDDEIVHQAVIPRRAATVAVGVLGGFIVGATSVGSGSLIVVALLLLYPTMQARDIVGTGLVQAIPLVGAAALGHVLFGNVQLGLTESLVLGSVPGVAIGARISSRAQGRLIRPVVTMVLLATGLKLLQVPLLAVGGAVLAAAVLGIVAWMLAKTRGEPAAAGGPRTGGTPSAGLTTRLRVRRSMPPPIRDQSD